MWVQSLLTNMYKHMCMYVHMYVCMHAYMHVCMYVCTYLSQYLFPRASNQPLYKKPGVSRDYKKGFYDVKIISVSYRWEFTPSIQSQRKALVLKRAGVRDSGKYGGALVRLNFEVGRKWSSWHFFWCFAAFAGSPGQDSMWPWKQHQWQWSAFNLLALVDGTNSISYFTSMSPLYTV